MNKNTLIGGLVILLIIGGFIIYKNKPNTAPLSTNTVVDTTEDTTNVVTNNDTRQGSAPGITTSDKVAPSDTSMVVTGTVNPNGAFTNYWYEYGPTTNLGSKTASQSVGSGFVSIPAPAYITGLTQSTTYYFHLVGENQYGKVIGSRYSFVTTKNIPAPVGGAPISKTVDASKISSTNATLNGQISSNKAITQYWFEYGTTPNLGNTTAFTSLGSDNTNVQVSLSLSGLNPNTTYYFRLDAQNQFSTVNGTTLHFKTSKN
ncbi:MAG: hypothetical protein WAV25_02990 [Minisyncoccia bacterium]